MWLVNVSSISLGCSVPFLSSLQLKQLGHLKDFLVWFFIKWKLFPFAVGQCYSMLFLLMSGQPINLLCFHKNTLSAAVCYSIRKHMWDAAFHVSIVFSPLLLHFQTNSLLIFLETQKLTQALGPCTYVENTKHLLASDPVQPQHLELSGQWTSGWEISPSVILYVTLSDKHTFSKRKRLSLYTFLVMVNQYFISIRYCKIILQSGHLLQSGEKHSSFTI